MQHNVSLGSFGRFLIAGGIATATQYLLLVVFVEFLELEPVASSAISFLIAALLNYAINYSYTFRSSLQHRSALPRFFVTVIAGVTINTIAMHVLVNYLSVFYLLAQIIATGITLIWNFAMHSIWSFKPRSQ